MIFSIAMDADYSFVVKNIKTWLPAFFKHNNSSVATVWNFLFIYHKQKKQKKSEKDNEDMLVY